MTEDKTKKELAIVLGATGNMTFALANVLIGLKKHSPNIKADIIIFHQNVSGKDKIILNKIVDCSFIEYNFPAEKFDNFTDDTLKKFTLLTFSRFECFNLLDKYKKVLWLDIDILIQKDIKPLFEECSTGISLMGRCKAGDDFTIIMPGLECDKENFNAGIMYLQDNLAGYENFANWCYKKTIELANYLKSADQGIINLMIKENNIEVHRLGWEYNFNPAYGGDTNQAVILHAFCSEKFWNYWDFKEWNENYKIWTKMGGSKYQGVKADFFERKFPHVPHPIKRPSKFIKYLINKAK